jgi:hypothetical protein
MAIDGAVASKGLNIKGALLLSGLGSIEITIGFPERSVGKDNPAGALITRSSPGNGGAAASLPL